MCCWKPPLPLIWVILAPAAKSAQRVVDPASHRIYLAGEMPRPEGGHNYRSMIGVINEDAPSLAAYLVPNTDDCNEFIGIALDTAGNRLIVGERWQGNGTPLKNSLWPNGGGLWSIPLATIDQTNTYTRIYQDFLNQSWDKMTVFNGRLFATVYNGGTEALISADLADVPAAAQMSRTPGGWRSPAAFFPC